MFDFSDNGCKKDLGAPPLEAIRQTRQSLRAEDVGPGLTCVGWAVSQEGKLVVDFVNIVDACGPSWIGSADLDAEAGKLSLRSEDPGCHLAACGSCLWDWSFEIEGDSFDRPLEVELTVDPCADPEVAPDYGTEPTVHRATLPLDESPTGSLCRYTASGGLSWAVSSQDNCGGQLTPCGDVCNFGLPVADAGSPCDPGLVCAPRPDDAYEVCQQPCTTDDDCALEQLTCVNGMCGLASPWLAAE